METFFETVYGLQKDGKFPVEGEKGAPNPFQGALILTEYDFFMAGMPIPLQRLIFRPLAFLGRRLGYKASYPRYSDDKQKKGSQ